MVKIKFDEELYNLPSEWDEVKIYQFQEIKKLDYAELGKLKYIIKLIQIFTGLPEDVIINSNGKALNKIYDVVSFIYKEPLPTKVTNKFIINDDVYTLKDFSNMTTGERISLEILLENPMDDIFPEIMALLFQKNDEPFDVGKMNDIADDIAMEVSVGQLHGVLLFFYHFEKSFLNNIVIYLEEQKEMEKMQKMTKMTRMKYKMKKKLKQILDYIGERLLMRWQKGVFWITKRFTKQTSLPA